MKTPAGEYNFPEARGRPSLKMEMQLMWAFLFFWIFTGFPTPSPAVQNPPHSAVRFTCDPERMDPESYRLVIRENPAVWIHPIPRGLNFFPQNLFEEQFEKTLLITRNAERARKLDPTNLMAQVILARSFLVFHDTFAEARDQWRRILDQGYGIPFDAVVYNVDTGAMFILRVTREALDFFTYAQFGVSHMGFPKEPGHETFWRARSGCIDGVEPVASVKWTDVTEMKSKHWVQELKLKKKYRIVSGRGKEKRVNRLKIAFLAGVGHAEITVDWTRVFSGRPGWKVYTYGPADYNARLRSVILENVDPEGRIKAPPAAKRGVGW